MSGDADTIFAVATGAGRAAIAVLRISGPQTAAIVAALASGVPEARRAVLRRLRDGAGAVLDRGLVLWLPGPASYTGEDSAELHLHGGAAVVEGVADRLVELGARPAEPGEFTRRAFLNARMDLLQAEAIADLIAAETSAQRQQALVQLGGGLGQVYRGWSGRLLRVLGQQEALIDFPDEDLPAELADALARDIMALRREISAHLDDERRGERLREGLVFAVAGPPNVGKSTLVNRLAGRDVAIVSPTAGTTRDVLEARVVLGGVPVTLLDTAGLRETADPVEAEGVRRALDRAAQADLLIAVRDRDVVGPVAADNGRCLTVATKADLGDHWPEAEMRVSAVTGAGLDVLRRRLSAIAAQLTRQAGPPALTRARHRAALAAAAAALGRSADAALPELRGEELRLAMWNLGRLTGQAGVEDILGSIFAQFCIGK